MKQQLPRFYLIVRSEHAAAISDAMAEVGRCGQWQRLFGDPRARFSRMCTLPENHTDGCGWHNGPIHDERPPRLEYDTELEVEVPGLGIGLYRVLPKGTE